MRKKNESETLEKVETAIVKATDDLKLGIPAPHGMPFGIRIIMLFTFLAGVAILGNTFADHYTPTAIPLDWYFFRLFIGIVLVYAAYQMHNRQLLSLWLLALVIPLGLTSNPLIGLMPLMALVYLWTRRSYFKSTKSFTLGTVTVRI